MSVGFIPSGKASTESLIITIPIFTDPPIKNPINKAAIFLSMFFMVCVSVASNVRKFVVLYSSRFYSFLVPTIE